MASVTQILCQIQDGDPSAADQLLPLVYDELKKLAASQLARERPGQTLQSTALVHEAYLRLIEGSPVPHWESRGHFFAAAALAMRRILVEEARRKMRRKRGGDRQRLAWDAVEYEVAALDDGLDANDLLALDEAITRLEQEDPLKAQIVQLRFFAGMTHDEVGRALGVSTVTARRHWRYARAWLRNRLNSASVDDPLNP